MADWYYTSNKQQMGPVSFPELRQLANKGLLRPSDLVWQDGMKDWVRASTQNLFAEDPGAGTAAPGNSPRPARRVENADDDRPRRSTREDDDDDELDRDRGRRRRTRRAEGGMPVGAKVGLIVGGVVIMLLVVGVSLYFLLRGDAAGTFQGVLGPNDMRDPKMGGPSRVYNIPMIANRTYVIDLRSNQFDSFLRLEDNAFRQLAQDDDSGGGLNARITFRCPRSDNYRVIATSLDQRNGAYTLSVREN